MNDYHLEDTTSELEALRLENAQLREQLAKRKAAAATTHYLWKNTNVTEDK